MSATKGQLSVFPVFMKVEGRFAVVVGDGANALAKASLLGESRIDIRIVSLTPSHALARYITQASLHHIQSGFSPDLLEGAALVFAATGVAASDAAIVAAARSFNIPANAVDRPGLCDFYTPALVNRAPLAIAIGSEGTGPVLAQLIRARIETLLPQSTGALARLASLYRAAADRLVPRGAARRRFWRAFFEGEISRHVENNDLPSARRAATRLLKDAEPQAGFVTLVQTGSGEADLQTLRTVRALQEADLVFHQAGLSAELLALGRRDADRIALDPAQPLSGLAATLAEHAHGGLRAVVLLSQPDALCNALACAFKAAGIGHCVIPGVGQSPLAANTDLAEFTATRRLS